jgi:exodeoxyribonuclease V
MLAKFASSKKQNMKTTVSANIFNLLKIEPTPSQSKALYEVVDFLENPQDEKIFILKGSAGTGKTTITKTIVDYANLLNLPTLLMAPTGKAASILNEKTGHNTDTIHHHIYLPKQLENGQVELTFRSNPSEVRTLYIIDEASMIASKNASSGEFVSKNPLLVDVLRFILEGHKDNQIIFIGDTYQLKPINETDSVALSAKILNEVLGAQTRQVSLTEVVRQAADSPVLKHALMVKDAKDFDKSIYKLQLPRLASENLALDYYMTFFERENPDEVIMICKSNEQVAYCNDKIRSRLGFNANTLTAGDLVISSAARYSEGQYLTNGEVGVVESISASTENIAGIYFKDITVRFKNNNSEKTISGKIQLNSLDGNRIKVDSELLRNLKGERMKANSKYRETQNAKDDPYMNALKLNYAYAITGYKAQGSEWKRVLFPSEKLSPIDHPWLYTVITRAKQEVNTWYFKNAAK